MNNRGLAICFTYKQMTLKNPDGVNYYLKGATQRSAVEKRVSGGLSRRDTFILMPLQSTLHFNRTKPLCRSLNSYLYQGFLFGCLSSLFLDFCFCFRRSVSDHFPYLSYRPCLPLCLSF